LLSTACLPRRFDANKLAAVVRAGSGRAALAFPDFASDESDDEG